MRIRQTLKDFLYMRECTRCSLSKTRNKVVIGSGPTASVDFMFVGEAPGENEDKTGEPFVGAAGKKFSELLTTSGIDRDKVYVTNIVKCRPPKNRKPQTNEVKACSINLLHQIRLVNPKVIITVGSTALEYFCNRSLKISSVHGALQKSRFVRQPIFPIIHPAAIFRNPDWEELILSDLKKLKELNSNESGSEVYIGPIMVER